jgi:hypothetical protein
MIMIPQRRSIKEPLIEGIETLIATIIENDKLADLQDWGAVNGVPIDQEGNGDFDQIDIPELQEIYSDLESIAFENMDLFGFEDQDENLDANNNRIESSYRGLNRNSRRNASHFGDHVFVKNQDDILTIPDDYGGIVHVDAPNSRITIGENQLRRATIVVVQGRVEVTGGRHRLEARRVCHLVAYGDCQIRAYNQSNVEAYDNCIVYASQLSYISVHDNCKVTAYDECKVTAYDNVELVRVDPGVHLEDRRNNPDDDNVDASYRDRNRGYKRNASHGRCVHPSRNRHHYRRVRAERGSAYVAERITVRTQDELDNVPADYDGIVEIRGDSNNQYEISKVGFSIALYAGKLRVSGKMEVTAYRESSVIAEGRCLVFGKAQSRIIAHGSCEVVAYGTCVVEAHDRCEVWSHDKSKVNAYDNCVVESANKSKVNAYDNCLLYAWDSSVIKLYDNAHIEADWRNYYTKNKMDRPLDVFDEEYISSGYNRFERSSNVYAMRRQSNYGSRYRR